MGSEVIIVVVVVVLALLGFVVLRSRQPALPAKPEARALPEEEAAGAPAEPKEEDAEPAAPKEAAGRAAAADEQDDRPSEDEPPAVAPNEDTLDSAEARVSPDASTVDDGGALRVDPDAETTDDGPKVEPGGAPRFVAPPLRGRSATPAPTTNKAPTPAPRPAAAVPLPVDKPKRTAQDDEAKREAERERYRKGLEKTRGGFVAKLSRLFRGKPKVDDDLRDRIEEVLFTADIGASTAEKLQAKVTAVLDRKEIADADAVWAVIRQAMLEVLELHAPPPDYAPDPGPYVLLMIGVNGVGKTTTLGKLAAQHARAGRKVLLVAGDTFRAAAVEQLDVWARRVGCEIHMGADKADPSSVIFEGIARARKEGFDVVLCDTAGRLHTRKELMDELAKVGRAAAKALRKGLPAAQAEAIEGAHDVYLVLDATIGQNALAQAKLFKDTIGFTGLVVTKLDGTAKGGVVLGICDELGVPIRYVGIGEGIDDLRAFDPEDFADALLTDRDALEASSA